MPAKPVLAIETSVEQGSVALVNDSGTLRELPFHAGRQPSSTLWPALESLCEALTGLSAVVVGTGPGSYNGSRVGIAAAQAISLVHDCPLCGFSSFQGVETRAPEALAIGDARRKSYSLQWLKNGTLQGDFELVDSGRLSEVITSTLAAHGDIFTFDDPDRFPLPNEVKSTIERRFSKASQLGQAYLAMTPDKKAELATKPAEPFYLRAPHITKGKRPSLLS